jgi:hypothetical protein
VSRSPVLTWLVLLCVALAFGVATWQAFGWFSSLRAVIVASLLWATLITGWMELRRHLPGRRP